MMESMIRACLAFSAAAQPHVVSGSEGVNLGTCTVSYVVRMC